MTDQEQSFAKQVCDWVTKHRPEAYPCPLCGCEGWEVGPLPVILQSVPKPSSVLSTAPQQSCLYALILVFCSECGYTYALNAEKAGIIKMNVGVVAPRPGIPKNHGGGNAR